MAQPSRTWRTLALIGAGSLALAACGSDRQRRHSRARVPGRHDPPARRRPRTPPTAC